MQSSDIGNGCYTSQQAKLLPESIWSCTVPRPGATEYVQALADSTRADVGKPVIECHYDSRAKCVVHPNCEWCKASDGDSALGGIGDGCYTKGEADLLPKKIWSCSVVAEAEEEPADAASATVGKPIVECHYDTQAKCVVHPDCEWCKTADKVRNAAQ